MSTTDEKIEPQDLIQKWLIQEGFKVQSIEDPKSWFNLLVEDKQGRKTNVAQQFDKVDHITIGTKLVIHELRQSKLRQMNDKERDNLFWELRLGLLDRGVGFSAITIPLKEIRVSMGIFYDGLSKDNFMRRLFDVRKALLYVAWIIERALGEPEPSERLLHIA